MTTAMAQSRGTRYRPITHQRIERLAMETKRARPSHKPRPKATCPHPTRPLRPPGRRARHELCTTRGALQSVRETENRILLRIFRALRQRIRTSNQEGEHYGQSRNNNPLDVRDT